MGRVSPGAVASPSGDFSGADFVIDPRTNLAKAGIDIHLLKV
jgi:hypothetical protein